MNTIWPVSALALFLLACGSKQEGPKPRQAVASRQDIRDVLTLSGTLEAAEEVGLKSEVSGQILKLRVEEGDSVRRGDTLVVIDPEQLRNRQLGNKITLTRSRILAEQAQRNLAMAESLLSVRGVSEQKLQDLRWQYQLNRLQVQQDSLSLRETEIQLRKTAVTAPITGFIIALDAKEGEVIVAGTASYGGGTTLGTIADLSQRKVTVKVSELDYPHLFVGQAAYVSTEAKPGMRFPGQVEYVGRMAKENTDRNVRQFDIRVVLDTLDAEANKILPPGATVTVEFTLIDAKDVLAIPYEAVQSGKTGKGKGDGGSFVWLKVPGGKSERRPVGLGLNNFSLIEITSGLKAGDTVMLEDSTGGLSAKMGPGGKKAFQK